MKILRISFVVASLVAAAPLASYAQHAAGAPRAHMAAGETHAHMAPHGGVVRSASPYHMELVRQTASLDIYLLGAQMNAVPNKGTTGSVMVQLANNTTSTVPLVLAGDDHFSAKLPTGAKVCTAIITLNADGKTINGRFDKLDEAAGSEAVDAAYASPLHPKVTSNKSGKCGMALVKKS